MRVNLPILRRGYVGRDVAMLQGLLSKTRCTSRYFAVDGDFGMDTEAAVRAFQRTHQLNSDGVVDSATWSALMSTSNYRVDEPVLKSTKKHNCPNCGAPAQSDTCSYCGTYLGG